MIRLFDTFVTLGVCTALLQPFCVYSSERLLEAGVDARTEYNDNIFLIDGPHDSVTGITVTPSLSGAIKEANWETKLNARLRINKYSDSALDGNDQFFDLTGQYNAQRNIYSLNVNHNLDSNLSSSSTDFGIVRRRVNRTNQSITPRYTRLLTERLTLLLSYIYSDVDFDDVENSGFTPFVSETGSASLIYNLTEKNQLTISLQIVDYRSKNDLQTFDLFTSSVGINHGFSETLSVDFLVGTNRRDSTNLDTASFNFFGQTITRTQEIDSKTRGLVLDAGVTKLLESGSISGRISRNDTTNSFGGLDQTDRFSIDYIEKLSSLWRYSINARFNNIESVSNATATDRDVFFFESKIYYSITSKWSTNASYRYTSRKFKSDTSEDRAPNSNRIYVGLTYNFPSLSTF